MITSSDRERLRAAWGVSEKPEPKASPFQNIKKIKKHRRKDRLTMSLSLTKDRINMGEEAALALGGADMRLNFLTAEYKGRPVMLIVPAVDGLYKLSFFRSRSWRVGTRALVGDLLAVGMPLGRYEVRKVRGGVMATVDQTEGVKPE